jgi:hypothetical protein
MVVCVQHESRQVMIGATAAFSPNGSNWGGRGGCLGFLVYLFCVSTSLYFSTVLLKVSSFVHIKLLNLYQFLKLNLPKSSYTTHANQWWASYF